MNNKRGQFEVGGGVIIVAILVVLGIVTFIVLGLGYDTVNASHIGVKNQFGVLTGTMQPGLQWTGLMTQVYQYDLRMRTLQVDMMSGEQTALDIDGQTVKARIQINYRLIPDNVVDAYSKVGLDQDLSAILNIDGIIREGFKATTAKYSSTQIWQQRQIVKDEAIKNIEANFPKRYFQLENVIISDIDFNPAFIAAIEAQKTNEKLALAKEKEVDIAKFEADRKVAETRGLQDSKKLEYEAEAYRIITAAKSEAEALGLKKAQLTPLMVEQSRIEAWAKGGSQVPKIIMGGSSDGLIMQMPTLDELNKLATN